MSLQELLLSEDVTCSINDNIDYLLEVIPELEYMIGFDHKHPQHHLDVWNHTLLALSLSKKDFDVRLCLLLHDIGKPFSYQEGKIRHYFNHPKVSADIAKIILNRLNYDKDYIEYMCYLIEHHDTPINLSQIKNNYEICLKLYARQQWDALAHNPNQLGRRKKYLKKTKVRLRNK